MSWASSGGRWSSKIFRELGKLRRVVIARMLDDAFADLKRQIQAGKIQVALLELLDDAQRLQIVIEAVAVRAQQLVELALSGVAEGRVADVVHQGQGFGEIGVERSAPATVRAICATSSVCVSRLRKWSE